MTEYGYTMMCEQSRPDQLVRDVQMVEDAGFDFSVISDHYMPWLPEQGRAGYAWSILGAAAQATSRLPLTTYVTCPTMRYHPAIVAQKASTVQILSEGRFRLGLGAGENLNEHVVGARWPMVGVRHQMLSEVVDIIGRLLDGEHVNHRGTYFDVESARLYDRHEVRPPIGIACSGKDSCFPRRKASRLHDLDRARAGTRPDARVRGRCRGLEGGQMRVSYDVDRDVAVQRAHDQFRWFGLGWKVNADLPGPASFESASQFVTPEQVGDQLPCGPDVEEYVEKLHPSVTPGSPRSRWSRSGATSRSPSSAGGRRNSFRRCATTELLSGPPAVTLVATDGSRRIRRPSPRRRRTRCTGCVVLAAELRGRS